MQTLHNTTALLTPSLVVQGTIELGAVAGDAVSIGMPEEQQLTARAALRHPPTANMHIPTPSVRNSTTVGSSVSSMQLPTSTLRSSVDVGSSLRSSRGGPLGGRPRSPPTHMHPANVAMKPQVLYCCARRMSACFWIHL